MLDKFCLAFIICFIYVAGFVLGWKAVASWEQKKEKSDATN